MPPLASLKTGIPYCGETGKLDALPSCLCRLALDSRRRTPIEIGETLLRFLLIVLYSLVDRTGRRAPHSHGVSAEKERSGSRETDSGPSARAAAATVRHQ
jgi:hypothetical protein